MAGCGRVDRIPTAAVERDADPSGLNRSASEPRSPSVLGFYPLDVGSRWQYAGESSKTIISSGGRDEKHGSWTREAVITRAETVNGRAYVREEDELDDPASPTGGPVHTVRWLRQDRSGLYELSVPPPGAPPSAETRLLAYPLHTGASWIMTEYPHTTATVEGMDVLGTPVGRLPAWRIRIRNGGHLPQEESFIWYGRAGYLRMKTHLNTGKPAPSGGIEIIEDQSESLTGLSITLGE